MTNAVIAELGRRAFLLPIAGDLAAEMVRYELGCIAAYGCVSWDQDLDCLGHVDNHRSHT